MQNMRDELEGIAFRELNPEANRDHQDPSDCRKLHEESGDAAARDREGAGDQARPRTASRRKSIGREKRPYSIWRKMERKHLSLGQLSDIFGFRVLVGTVDQCYRAIGIVSAIP